MLGPWPWAQRLTDFVTGPPSLAGEPQPLLPLTCEETEVKVLTPGHSVRKCGWGPRLGVACGLCGLCGEQPLRGRGQGGWQRTT